MHEKNGDLEKCAHFNFWYGYAYSSSVLFNEKITSFNYWNQENFFWCCISVNNLLVNIYVSIKTVSVKNLFNPVISVSLTNFIRNMLLEFKGCERSLIKIAPNINVDQIYIYISTSYHLSCMTYHLHVVVFNRFTAPAVLQFIFQQQQHQNWVFN